jgi:hypothetical protein
MNIEGRYPAYNMKGLQSGPISAPSNSLKNKGVFIFEKRLK